MTELDQRKSPWNEGLEISGEFLDHQLYLLGCLFHASPAFDKLPDHPLIDLRKNYQEAEIGKIFITIAATIRNAMDQNPWRAEQWLEDIKDNVGTLKRMNNKNQKEIILNFREACNKIIHCTSINFHYISKKPRRGMALETQVSLYGIKGKEEWKATVDINKFIEVAFQLT